MESYNHSNTSPPEVSRVTHIQQTFGGCTAMVAVECGTKRAVQKGFQNFTDEVMRDTNHLALLERSNIGILVGSLSFNLVSIDFDDDMAQEEFIEANPSLAETRTSKVARGVNLWFQKCDDFPGKIIKLKRDGKEIGEWCSYRVDPPPEANNQGPEHQGD